MCLKWGKCIERRNNIKGREEVRLVGGARMAGEEEAVERELTRLAVEAREMVQDFPLCSTFREVEAQNALVRGVMEGMRGKLTLLDTLALEHPSRCSTFT